MRKILLPIDPSAYTQSAFRYASLFSEPEHSVIEGVAIIDVLDVLEHASSFLPLPQGLDSHRETEEKLLKDVRESVKEELRTFEKACQSKNVNCTIKIFEGRPDYIIEKESLYSDLVIIGLRNFFHFEREDKPETSLVTILGHTISPILGVTQKFLPIKKVLLTYDGSIPSVRAIQQFAFMMRKQNYAAVLLTKSKNEEVANTDFQKIEAYIEQYGEVKITRKWTSQSLIKTFKEEYLGKVDVVVCGMHSQNFLKSFFVGSFPKYLIDLNKVPVFIGQ